MARLNEGALKRLIKGGETTTVEFKVATPRPVEMAERLCGMANAQGGMIIIGVEDLERKVVGVPDERMAMTNEFIITFRSARISPILRPQEPQVSKTLWDEDEQLSALPTSTEELSDAVVCCYVAECLCDIGMFWPQRFLPDGSRLLME